MTNIEQLEKFIQQGESFLGKNYTSDNPEFEAWNNSVKRLIERIYGKKSTTFEEFESRVYTLRIWTTGTPESSFVNAFEHDLKVSIADLKSLLEEEKNNIPVINQSLDTVRPKTTNITVNTQISNSNNNINNISSNLLEQIKDDPNLDDESIKTLINYIKEIESKEKKKDKWNIMKKITNFLVDKGMDAFITCLPQIITLLKGV